jgi:hypothetical protein
LLKLSDYLYDRQEVKVSTLKERLQHFLAAMQEIVSDAPGKYGQFALDSVTISAEISAQGKVSLLGTGGEAGGKGGISFTLKRLPPQP